MSDDMSSPFSVSNSIASVSGIWLPKMPHGSGKSCPTASCVPGACHADRLDGGVGYCGQTADIMAARASLHYWEEPVSPVLPVPVPSFSGCNLRCVFCQNHNIALGKAGRVITPEHLVKIFLQLQEQVLIISILLLPTFSSQIVIALGGPKSGTVHPHCIQYRQLRISGGFTPSGWIWWISICRI